MSQSIIFYTKEKTNRLLYVLKTIEERLDISFKITDEITKNETPDFFINYSEESLKNGLKIIPNGIIKATGIKETPLHIHRWKHTTIIFYNQPGALVPFDIIGAIFFHLSRYEEYLPHSKDKHGRFPASASVAYKFNFLDMPVVDIWIKELGKIIEHNTGYEIKKNKLEKMTTFDIDLLWKFEGKSLIKTVLTKIYYNIKKGSKTSLNTKSEDPYFCFERIQQTLLFKNKTAIFFLLNPEYKTKYDRITPWKNEKAPQTIKNLNTYFELGIHPSYFSEIKNDIKTETDSLGKMIEKNISKSRMHYIKLRLPYTYQKLIELGIKEDYTMGFPDQNGFRASTNFPFLWYDLINEKSTELIIHPFSFMDATSIFYLKQNAKAAENSLQQLVHNATISGGQFITIWHNYIIGDKDENKGWWEIWNRWLDDN